MPTHLMICIESAEWPHTPTNDIARHIVTDATLVAIKPWASARVIDLYARGDLGQRGDSPIRKQE